MATPEPLPQETFSNFMTHVVLHHRQGDAALASAAGWIAAAHAIRVVSIPKQWGQAADEIATCLERAYWECVAAYERQKQDGSSRASAEGEGLRGDGKRKSDPSK